MKVIKTEIEGLLILEPKVFGDTRGFFYESFNQQVFQAATGLDIQFVQDNHSLSCKGVLRGLHYQLPPYSQGKLVRCVSGMVFDVAVDIRLGSTTFGKWVGIELSETNFRQFWIPPGFAHGFLTLSEKAEFLYKTTAYYAPTHDRSIRWNDSSIGIVWPDIEGQYQLSSKDSAAKALAEADLC